MTSSRGDWAKSECEIKTVASANNQALRRSNQKPVAADVRRLTLMRKAELGLWQAKIRVSSRRQLQRKGFFAAGRCWQSAKHFRQRNSRRDRLRVMTWSLRGHGKLLNPKVERTSR